MAFRIKKLKTKYKNSALCLTENLVSIYTLRFIHKTVVSNLRKQETYIILIIFSLLIGCKDNKKEIDFQNRKTNSEWSKIEYKERNVEFKFPAKDYKIEHDTLKVDWLGNVHLQRWTFNTKNEKNYPNFGYSFSHYKYPEHNFTKEEIDEFFDGIVKNLMDALDAELIYNRQIDYHGNHGRELYYFMPSTKIYLTERTYLINNEQYALTVITKKEKILNKSIKTFLESFAILK
ncbi:hypothetical protein [Algibacter lectus]|uniref:hypothetical protein n=1 Tax=Algibacter lectus TaxID=221126 RepID=UPI001269A523|nr:hypothetical protein [Algibacter lectus]